MATYLRCLTKTLMRFYYYYLDEVFFLNLSDLLKVTQLITVHSQIQVCLDPELMLHSTTFGLIQ